jgi:hypothetical protein
MEKTMNSKSLRITVTDKDMKDVESIRRIINANDVHQDALVDLLASRMNLTDEQRDIFWDFVYNQSEWMVDRVRDSAVKKKNEKR